MLYHYSGEKQILKLQKIAVFNTAEKRRFKCGGKTPL
jgi:hypothetical protein